MYADYFDAEPSGLQNPYAPARPGDERGAAGVRLVLVGLVGVGLSLAHHDTEPAPDRTASVRAAVPRPEPAPPAQVLPLRRPAETADHPPA